jgi:hypothetical protein
MPLNTESASKVWYRYAYCRDNGHAQYVLKADTCEQFFQGNQWTEADRAALRAARRPALTINKIISTIGNVMGEQIYNRSEISFRPKSGADPATADVLTKVFKQISDNNQLDWRRSDMFADGIITSRGYLDVRLDFNASMQGEVRIETINPKNVIVDNDAEEHDPDSWNEVFVTKWMTADDIAILYSKEDAEYLRNRDDSYYPYGYDSIDNIRDRFGLPFNANYGGQAQAYDESPVVRSLRVIERQHRIMDRQKHFIDPKTGNMRPVPEGWDRDRIAAVVQQFGYQVIPRLVKRIRWTVICDNVVLHDDWSPYKHFTVIPYFPYFRRGTTIGLVENLVGPQELLNKVTSQELHVVNSSANGGYKVKSGALATMSIEELEQRGAETGLVIEMANSLDDIEKLQPNATPQGLDRISYKAEESIKTISGITDSQQGQDREDVAAKAIQEKKKAANTNLAKPLDSLVRTDFMIARNVLDLVQTFYTEERILTITHDTPGGGTENVTINQVQPDGTVVNDLMLGEFDVTISSVPQRETLEDSQFDQAVSMKKDLGINIPDAFIINTSRLLNKNDLIKQMQAASQSPEAQEQQKLALRQQTAEVTKTEAETKQKDADAVLKDAKARKEGVATQKEAMTPIEGPEAESQAEQAKVQAEIALNERKFQHEQQMAQQKFQLEQEKLHAELQMKREEMNMKAQLDQKAAAEKAVSDRIAARSQPKPQPGTKT